MGFIYYEFTLGLPPVSSKKNIVSGNIKPCISCKHVIRNTNSNSNSKTTLDVYYCGLFEKVSPTIGKRIYEECSDLRRDLEKCGPTGIYFKDIAETNN